MARASFTTRINVIAKDVPPPAGEPITFAAPTIFLPRDGSTSLVPYVSGGTAPYGQFAVETGSLPSGVTVSAAGLVSAASAAALGDRAGLVFRVRDAAGATAYSSSVTISVYDPYAAVPAKGIAKQVAAANWFEALKPPEMSMTAWRYAAFGSFGSGVFNPYYSVNGAYILSGSGGHDHPAFFGDLIFNFDTMLGSYQPCANPGIVDRETSVPESLTNLAPWWEMNASAEVPAPTHPYKNLQVIPPGKGGSAKGSMVYLGRGAIDARLARSGGAAHSKDLVTRLWKRQQVDGAFGYASVEQATVYDEDTNRYYQITPNLQYTQALRYLDGADWKWKDTAKQSGYGPGPLPGTPAITAWIQRGGGVKALMLITDARLYAINLDAPASGWVRLTTTGDALVKTYSNPVLHKAQNIVYQRLADDGQGQKLVRMTPPSGSPIANGWNIDSISLGGAAIPDYRAANVGTSPYRNLMYIDKLQMLGWVTANGCYLLNP